MRRAPLLALAAALLLAVSWVPAGAVDWGVRAGTTMGGGTSFNSQEVYFRTGLPWSAGGPQGWRLTSHLEVNAGRLSGGGQTTSYGGTGVTLWARDHAGPLSLSVGTGPTYISDRRLGDRDLGGNWQFTSHAAAYVRLSANVAAGYRIQHTSNAGLYSPNDGYNVQAFELRARF
ncbi:acyloxyacyl hydrolase [Ectothiorhodospiraceae bacterium 2226]|nr:acyloxyacyl hydrolase [Ectothiorhodospiraceae bacterium 2226]